MKNKSNGSLLGAFPKADKEAWIATATKDLRGGSFDEKLIWKTAEGFDVAPFYTSEDLKDLKYQNGYMNMVPGMVETDASPRHWINQQQIVVEDIAKSNEKALHALLNGADGIDFVLNNQVSQEELRELLKDLLLPSCEISFVINQSPAEFIAYFTSFSREKGFDPGRLYGSLSYDLKALEKDREALPLFIELPHFRGLVIKQKTTEIGSTGKGLGLLLADAVDLVESLQGNGAGLNELFSNIQFELQLGDDYFTEIARLKALRFLFHRIMQQYGVQNIPADSIDIHAVTSITIDSQTKEDPYLNMLSNTGKAMAAVIGGCNSLTVLPHNEGIEPTDAFAEHIARNVSNILKEEAYFDKVLDPAAGSYYIMNLTHEISRKAWEHFTQLV